MAEPQYVKISLARRLWWDAQDVIRLALAVLLLRALGLL